MKPSINVRHPPSAVVGVVAFPALFGGLSQIPPQVAALGTVPPDVLVDGLVAEAPVHEFETADMADDLLGRVLLSQQFAHQQEIGFSVVSIAP